MYESILFAIQKPSKLNEMKIKLKKKRKNVNGTHRYDIRIEIYFKWGVFNCIVSSNTSFGSLNNKI